MGTILDFTAQRREMPGTPRPAGPGQVVIFPGARIERAEVDLSHRLRDSVSLGEFADLANGGHPHRSR